MDIPKLAPVPDDDPYYSESSSTNREWVEYTQSLEVRLAWFEDQYYNRNQL